MIMQRQQIEKLAAALVNWLELASKTGAASATIVVSATAGRSHLVLAYSCFPLADASIASRIAAASFAVAATSSKIAVPSLFRIGLETSVQIAIRAQCQLFPSSLRIQKTF